MATLATLETEGEGEVMRLLQRVKRVSSIGVDTG